MNHLTTSTWNVDPGHSAVQFNVQHLAIANVCGAFLVFAGTVQTDRDDFVDAQVQLELEVASLSTNNALRDTHLKSDVFFDAEQFPTLAFSGVLRQLVDQYALTGRLTIRGVAKEVTLAAAFTGTGIGRWGDTRAGFALTGTLNRTDFGLTWNMLTELGSLLIGEDIGLRLDVELIKAPAAVPAVV